MTIKINKNKDLLEELKRPSLGLQITNRYLVWILVLIIIIVLSVGYSFVLDKKISDVRNTGQEFLPAKEKILSDLRAIEKELDAIISQFRSIKVAKQAQLDKLKDLLPDYPRYVDLFAVAEDLTTIQGMKLNAISITFADTPVAAAPVEPSGAAVAIPTDIKAMTIKLQVSGGDYEGFKKYLQTLERSIRLFDVGSVAFAGSSFAPSSPTVETEASFDLEVRTYYRTK